MSDELLPERRVPDPTLLEIGTALTANVGVLGARIEALADKGRSRQIQIIVLAISVLLDIVLSVGLFIAVDRTNHQQDALRRAVNTAKTQCEATNASSLKQIQLWEGVLNLEPAPGQPKSDPKTVARFRQLLDDTFRLQDCSKVNTP